MLKRSILSEYRLSIKLFCFTVSFKLSALSYRGTISKQDRTEEKKPHNTKHFTHGLLGRISIETINSCQVERKHRTHAQSKTSWLVIHGFSRWHCVSKHNDDTTTKATDASDSNPPPPPPAPLLLTQCCTRSLSVFRQSKICKIVWKVDGRTDGRSAGQCIAVGIAANLW